MKNLLLLLIISIPLVSNAQVCETGEGNIFNATLILDESAVSPAGPNESFVAMSDGYCVGESAVPNPGARATALTIWGQDSLSPERNGLQNGDTFEIFLKTTVGTVPLPMETDAIYVIKAASIDTVLSPVLDSLMIEVATLATVLDSTITADSTRIAILEIQNNGLLSENSLLQIAYNAEAARADSLQGLVDNFPSETADLQQRLDSANDRISVLEGNLTTANTQGRSLMNAIQNLIRKLRK